MHLAIGDIDADRLVFETDLVAAVGRTWERRGSDQQRGERDAGRDLGRVGGESEAGSTPTGKLCEHRAQRLAGLGQLVSLCSPRSDLLHDAMLLEGAQAGGEDVGPDTAETVQQIGVAARPQEQVAHDQERPAFSDDVERRAHGAERLVSEGRGHLRIITDLTWIIQAAITWIIQVIKVGAMFEKLASFVYRNSGRVLLVALVGVGVAGMFGLGVAKRLSPYGDSDPSTQSVQVTNRYQAATGRQIDPGVIALVRLGDVHTAGAERRVSRVAARLRSSRDIASVASYYDTHDPAMLSRDGRSTYVVAYFDPKSDLRIQEDAQRLEREFSGDNDVKLGGSAIASAQANTQVSSDLGRAELLAFPFIFLLSLLFFRSLVASLLPPLLGVLAILATFFALRIVSSFFDLSVFALNIVTGLGLGLAIDYSLFTVSRYREESARAGFGVEALRRTLATAGRTIAFSSLTVAVAVASLTVFPQNFLRSMGIAGALVALIAAALALIVLPAILALLGPR